MQKAGLSEEIILSKIGTSTTNFDTGTQDLIHLKEAGFHGHWVEAVDGLAAKIVAADAAQDSGAIAQAAGHDSEVGRRPAETHAVR